MTPEQAIDILAREVLATGDERAWETYSDISEDDWERILTRMDELTPAPDPERFRAAYDLLSGQASDAEASP